MRLRNEIELCGFFQRVSAPIRPSNSGHNLSKIGHPLRRPQSRASVRQTERVLLRTTIAQILGPISPYSLVVRPLRTPRLRAEPKGGGVAGATPPFAHSTRLRTPVALRITRVRCLPPYGGVAPATVILAGRLGLRRAETA